MAQLQKGTTYITGDQVTAANLNALVDSGILTPGAVTDQTAKTVPLAADTILLHSAADTALRKTTMTQLFATPQPLGATTPSSVAATTGTFSSTLGVTGVATLGNGAILGTPASGNLASCTGYVGTSALVTVGALNSGSITSGFGAIDVGADAISGGAGAFSTLSATGATRITTNNVYFAGTTTGAANQNLIGVGGDDNTYIQYKNGQSARFSNGVSNQVEISATGAAITGTITSTGNMSVTGNGGFFNSGSAPISFTSDTTAPGYTYLDIYRVLNVRNTNASYATLGTWSATGLAVTGTLSATGTSGTHSFNTTGTEVIAISKSGGNSAYLATVGSSDAGLQVKDSSGTITLTVGTSGKSVSLQGGTVSTGTGIAFPATQVASSNGNTLDDYEESTWSPTFTGNTGTITYTGQDGYYTKIGNLVHCSVYVTCTGVAGTGTVTMSLPFTCQNANAGVFAFNDAGHTIGVTSTADNPRMRTVANSALLQGVKSLGNTTYLTYAELCSGGTLEFSIEFSYLANP